MEVAEAMYELEQIGEYRNVAGQDQHIPQGSTILGGHYRLLYLLHQRPRLNLYLGRRISPLQRHEGYSSYHGNEQGPLVAIRELVLTNLPSQVRTQVEQAAFEEFVSPMAPGLPRLANSGDRMFVENERHYLVVQLSETKGEHCSTPMMLAELLLQPQWPSWLDTVTALAWGVQLCRSVARLHRLGVVLGDLDAGTILLSGKGEVTWSPVLLASWPPPPLFWPASSTGLSAAAQYQQIFPIAVNTDNVFMAPEMMAGVCDERADVYSLGALLYLLCTHYAPAAALRRQYAALSDRADRLYWSEGMTLIPPHLLNNRLPSTLERVLLHALALDPAQRYPSAFALVEALESL